MLRVTVDARPAQHFLGAVARQVPYAFALALNRTAEEAVEAQRAGMRQRFTIRRPWVLNQVRVLTRARKDAPTAAVGITGRAHFLRKFEEGGERSRGVNTLNPIAIPTDELRPVRTANIPLAYYPKHLRLETRRDVVGYLPARSHVTRRGVVQLKGLRRTFVLDPAQHRGVGTWGIYQREGPNDIRLLWVYRNRVRIPAILQLARTVHATVAARWQANMAGMLAHAVATAR